MVEVKPLHPRAYNVKGDTGEHPGWRWRRQEFRLVQVAKRDRELACSGRQFQALGETDESLEGTGAAAKCQATFSQQAELLPVHQVEI